MFNVMWPTDSMIPGRPTRFEHAAVTPAHELVTSLECALGVPLNAEYIPSSKFVPGKTEPKSVATVVLKIPAIGLEMELITFSSLDSDESLFPNERTFEKPDVGDFWRERLEHVAVHIRDTASEELECVPALKERITEILSSVEDPVEA